MNGLGRLRNQLNGFLERMPSPRACGVKQVVERHMSYIEELVNIPVVLEQFDAVAEA